MTQAPVVIDDPVTSLDEERLYATVDLIGNLADR
jgi:wobble nucleotide-excising tRNase